MKVKTFLLLVAILLVAAYSAYGVTGIKEQLRETDFVFRVSCEPNAAVFPDNPQPGNNTKAWCWIYRDWTGNGPDVPCTNVAWWTDTYVPGGIIRLTTSTGGDSLIPTYTGSCTSANTGKFPVNGDAVDYSYANYPGGFVSSRYFQSCTNYNAPRPVTFFCVFTYTDASGNRVVYVSDVWTAENDNANHPKELTGYCCFYHSAVVPCVPSAPTVFPVNGSGQQVPPRSACVTICPSVPYQICIGPISGANHIPHVQVAAGCDHPPFCQTTCTQAQGFVWANSDETGWTFDGTYMCKNITWLPDPEVKVGGCVCITFDYLLAANMGEVSILPLDNAVKLTWKTLSETSLDKFIVRRDGAIVYQVDATNLPNGHDYAYTDETAVNGTTYSYSLISRNADGSETVVRTLSATPSIDAAVVTEYALRQNYPNPFNPTTKIVYDVKESNLVTLKVYNAAGQEVTTLVNNESKTNGRYTVNFDATNLPSGLYFYSIKIGNAFSATKKMLLVK